MQPSHCNPDTLDRAWKPPTQPRRPNPLDRLREALIYGHVLNRGPTGAPRSADGRPPNRTPHASGGPKQPRLGGGVLLGVPSEDVMPIRIRCRDDPLDRQQPVEYKGVHAPSARNPTACYTGRKPKLHILCGSI